MIDKYIEEEAWESGFARVYIKEIAPKLRDLETDRKKARRTVLIRSLTILPIAAGLVIWGLTWLFMDSDFGFWATSFWLVVAFSLLFIAWIYAGLPTFNYSEKWGKFIIQTVCNFVGDISYSEEVGKPIDPKAFASLGLIPSMYGCVAKFEDLLMGTVNGKEFRWMEGSIRSAGGQDTYTDIDFAGWFLSIDVRTAFHGSVRVSQKKQTNWSPKDNEVPILSKPIELDNANFAEAFEIQADDREEAQKLLTPEFCDFLLALAERYRDGRLTAAFSDGLFNLAVETEEDLMGQFDDKKSAAEIQGVVSDLLRDIHAIHQFAASVP